MTLFWIIVVVGVLYGIIAVAGRWLLQAVVALAAIVATPVRESRRLRKAGNRRRANWLLGSFIFAMVSWTILIALLIAMPK